MDKFNFSETLSQRFFAFIEPRRQLAAHGIISRLNYDAEDLALITINIMRAGFRTSFYNIAPIEINHLGTFPIVDDHIIFEPDQSLLIQIRDDRPTSTPSWADTLGARSETLDQGLMVKILVNKISPFMDGDAYKLGSFALDFWTAAVSWFLARCKPVMLPGIGEFKASRKPEVLYNPDPILAKSLRLGLKRRGRVFVESFQMDRDPGATPAPEEEPGADWINFYTHLISGLELTAADQDRFRMFVKKLDELKSTSE